MKAVRAACTMVLLIASTIAADAAGADPAVPPAGNIGGGIPVAVICSGLDYTGEEIAHRLARDGEGEIIGYDYVDDDRRPFARDNRATQDLAEILLGEGQTSTLAVIRASLDQMISLGHALLFAGKSPAPIIVIETTPKDRDAIAALDAAIRHFHDRLFIVAAGDDGRDLDQDEAARLRGLPNLLLVAASDAAGAPIPGGNSGALAIDVATTGMPLKGEDTHPADDAGASIRAAAHMAAVAVRLKAVEPAIPAAALKSRITGLARKASSGAAIQTVYGLIERPQRYFWLE